MPTQGTLRASAKARAADIATRRPVKEPGPTVVAMRSISEKPAEIGDDALNQRDQSLGMTARHRDGLRSDLAIVRIEHTGRAGFKGGVDGKDTHGFFHKGVSSVVVWRHRRILPTKHQRYRRNRPLRKALLSRGRLQLGLGLQIPASDGLYRTGLDFFNRILCCSFVVASFYRKPASAFRHNALARREKCGPGLQCGKSLQDCGRAPDPVRPA